MTSTSKEVKGWRDLILSPYDTLTFGFLLLPIIALFIWQDETSRIIFMFLLIVGSCYLFKVKKIELWEARVKF